MPEIDANIFTIASETAFFSLVCPQVVDTQPKMTLLKPWTSIHNPESRKHDQVELSNKLALGWANLSTSLCLIWERHYSALHSLDAGTESLYLAGGSRGLVDVVMSNVRHDLGWSRTGNKGVSDMIPVPAGIVYNFKETYSLPTAPIRYVNSYLRFGPPQLTYPRLQIPLATPEYHGPLPTIPSSSPD